jgi:hypothetical protein
LHKGLFVTLSINDTQLNSVATLCCVVMLNVVAPTNVLGHEDKLRINTLAYLSGASAMKTRTFYKIETWTSFGQHDL